MIKFNIRKYINSSIKSLKSNKLFKPICMSIIIIAIIMIALILVKKLVPVEYSSYLVNGEKVSCDIDNSNRALFTEDYDVTFKTPNANFEIVIPIEAQRNYDTLIKSIKCEGYKIITNRQKDYISVVVKVSAKENENTSSYNRHIVLNYVVDRGEDFDDSYDYIDYYLASPYRGYKLNKFDFVINFPKSIKSSIDDTYRLFTKHELYNEELIFQKNNTRVALINDGYTITGNVTGGLNAYVGVKIDHMLYNNYFEDVRNSKSDSNKLIGLYIIFFFICFINFFLCGKDGTLIYHTSEEIPSQISPLLCALFTADGSSNENKINEYEFKHLSSLIIKWANEGYLTIEPYKVHISLEDEVAQNEKQLEELESGKKNVSETSEYRIEYRFRKLKEAMRSSMPYFEKFIFDGLFVLSVNGCVDTNVIKNNMLPFKEYLSYFTAQINNAKQEVLSYAKSVKDNFLDKRAKRMKNDIKIISFIMWVVTIGFELIIHHFYIKKMIVPVIFIMMLAILYFLILNYNNFVNIVSSLIVLAFGYFFVPMSKLAFVLLALTTILIVIIRKYTFQYELIVEKIKSFTRFLSKKGDRTGIVNALNDNPKFFYEAVPYAITFKKLNVLVKRCKEFNLAMPGWLIMQPEGFTLDVILDMDKEINEIWSSIIEENCKNVLESPEVQNALIK